MSKPILAIVGRPNVGKSTIFNMLAGERLSIVDDSPGVTRDRIFADSDWLHRDFTVIDTGGIEPESDDAMLKRIREQAYMAIETADVILFVCDVKTGLTDADRSVADILRKSKKPVVLCINKVDSFEKYEPYVYEFYNIGLGDPHPISAIGKLGIGDLLDAVLSEFPEGGSDKSDDDTPRIAIVGRPNAGKSSLINKLSGEERAIVSPEAGTTRDAIDSVIRRNKKDYIFVDTAGLRRKSKINDQIERYSVIRAVSAVEKADVAILLIDASEGITEQDAKIAGIAHERGKGIIIAVNKWDIIEKDNKTIKKFEEEIRKTLNFMPYASLIFISVKTGQRIDRLFPLIDATIENRTLRVATGVLNEIITEALAMHQPPSDKGKRLKVYYVTQVAVKPPSFAVFVNKKELMHFTYLRYLENKIREAFGFEGTRLKFFVREKKD